MLGDEAAGSGSWEQLKLLRPAVVEPAVEWGLPSAEDEVEEQQAQQAWGEAQEVVAQNSKLAAAWEMAGCKKAAAAMRQSTVRRAALEEGFMKRNFSLLVAVAAENVGELQAQCQALHQRGSDALKTALEVRNDNGHTPYVLACRSLGASKCLTVLHQAMFIKGACDLEAVIRSTNGTTGLMLAVESRNPQVVEAVLKGKAGVDGRQDMGEESGGSAFLEAKCKDSGWTAFLWACHLVEPVIVSLLIQAGCNTDARAANGETGLILAAKGKCVQTISQVVQAHKARNSELTSQPSSLMEMLLLACFYAVGWRLCLQRGTQHSNIVNSWRRVTTKVTPHLSMLA